MIFRAMRSDVKLLALRALPTPGGGFRLFLRRV